MRQRVTSATEGIELYEKERAHRMARKLGLHIVSSRNTRPQDDPQRTGDEREEGNPGPRPDTEIDWDRNNPGR